MDEEIKPCPWCKEIPKFVPQYYAIALRCENPECPVRPSTKPVKTKLHATQIWNRREREHD